MGEEEKADRERRGLRYGIRFLVPEGAISFDDLVYGRQSRENAEIEDFVLVKSDGMPSYQLACVADDLEMRISHVIRGDDHIANTFKQTLLYQALGIDPPKFAHLPLILGADRAKLSKRKGAVAVTDYRDRGFLPEAMVNFLVLLGWAPGDDREFLTRKEMIELFSLERVNTSGAVFDVQKLEWMNYHYLQQLSDEELLDAVMPALIRSGYFSGPPTGEQKTWVTLVLSLLKGRAKVLTDFSDLGSYFFSDRIDYNPVLLAKHFSRSEAREALKLLSDRFRTRPEFKRETIETDLREVAQERGLRAADLIHPLRVAVSGRETGPGLFEMLEVLGKEKVLERIDKVFSKTS